MHIKNLIDEDFVNYRKPSMFISAPFCDWKCCREQGRDICMCQNSPAYNSPIVEISDDELVRRFADNPITSAIVVGGFEPLFDSWFHELLSFIRLLRTRTDAECVIFTGYDESEVKDKIEELRKFGNVIVKFGRFIPDCQHHLDELLGVELASPNQHAVMI